MAGGWTRDGAVQDQIDASTDEAVKQARSLLPSECALPIAKNAAQPYPTHDRQRCRAYVYVWRVSPSWMKS